MDKGTRPNLLSGKTWLAELETGELGSLRLGQLSRLGRRVWAEESSGQVSSGQGIIVRLIGAGELGSGRSAEGPKISRELELGMGNSGQYRSEQVTMINKTRKAQARGRVSDGDGPEVPR